ncbi:MAG: MFS transporter [Defluviitaleaceae bacterium]|nr:MFS transporter [Defluviitaleaceae bacterium]
MKNRLPLFYIVTIFFWMSLYTYVPYVTPYAEQMQADLRLIGLIAGSYGFVQMAIRFPLGIISDRLQKRKIFVLLGLFFATISGVSVFLWANPIVLLVARSLAGVTAATWVTFTILGASYYKPEDTIRSIGLLNAANGFGRMAALLLGGLFAEWLGFSYAFLLGGILGLAGLIFGIGMRESKPDPEKTSNPPNLAALLEVAKDKQLICASVLAIVSQYIMFATTFGFTPMVANDMGASNYQLGLLGVISTLPALLISPIMVKVVNKIGVTATLVWGFALAAVGTVLVVWSQNLLQLFAVQFLSSLGLSGLMTVLMGLSIKAIASERRATAMGFFQAAYGLGMFLGPFATGWISHSFTMSTAFVVTGLIGFVGLVSSVVFVKRGYILQT